MTHSPRGLLLLALAAAPGEQERPLPAGTVLSIRLTSAVASHSARVGDAVGGHEGLEGSPRPAVPERATHLAPGWVEGTIDR